MPPPNPRSLAAHAEWKQLQQPGLAKLAPTAPGAALTQPLQGPWGRGNQELLRPRCQLLDRRRPLAP
eukprot:15439661-Alexandrium_andersonii.AAC.1